MRFTLATTALLASLLITADVHAKNVDLVTLPKRDTVQLTIYNSEDITLAKEVRSVTLKKGANRLQFSWAGTLIDPTSVELRPLQHTDEIEVTDAVFPGQKPQHLIWNIESEFEGQVLVEVSYFTSGLTWRMDYVAISNPDETQMVFDGHVRVFNNSGEQYENAEIRLIVGKINLVEKIAELAKRQGKTTPTTGSTRWRYIRQKATLGVIRDAEEASDESGGDRQQSAQIVKQGVSEYFMFSVDGRETISNGWSKRMPAVHAAAAAFDIVYRLRSYQYGPRPVRFFKWKNDEAHQLGDSPLPDGVVRVFRDNGRDGLSFLGQQTLNYVPIQADIEVNLGFDDLVVYEQTKSESRRNNFQFNRHNNVSGWDEHQKWLGVVRNYHGKPIKFELRLQLPGDIEFKATAPTTSFNFQTVETIVDADARGNFEFPFTTTIHHAANAKQNRVRLRQAN